MVVIWIATIALCVFATWFMHERIKGYSKKDVVLKVICSVCFLTVAVMALSMNFSTCGLLFLLGGMTGAVGDFCLGLSHIYKNKKRMCMALGFIGFGVGHVLFFSGAFFNYRGIAERICYVIPFAAAVTVSVCLGTFGRKIGLHFGRFLPVVMLYVFLLCFLVFFTISLNMVLDFKNTHLKIFGIGMLMFMISDSILSGMYFGKTAHSSTAVILNHVTYYLAQWFIAFSILFV